MTIMEGSSAQIGICPGCGARIRFQNVVLGEFVVCEECGDELEIVQMKPLKLDWAYSEPYTGDEGSADDFDEDWDDEDDWEDDDDDNWDD